MAIRFTFGYEKLKFLEENITNKNIHYFAAYDLDPTFKLSLRGEAIGKEIPEIACSLSSLGIISKYDNTLYKSIIDFIGLIKYKSNYFTYCVEKKHFVQIRNNFHLINYLYSLTCCSNEYYTPDEYLFKDLKLYKIIDYDISYK